MKNYESFVNASIASDFIETVTGEAPRIITGEWLKNSSRLYRFDVFNASVKSMLPFAPVTHTDTAKFNNAVKGEWYSEELKNVESLINDMRNVTEEDKKDATKGMTPDAVKKCAEGFTASMNRAFAIRDILRTLSKPASMTVSVIVAVVHGNKTTNCAAYIESMYNVAKTGKETETKTAILDFVKAFWVVNENDGILEYSCNVTKSMTRDVISAANGRHVFRNGYAKKANATQKQVMNECVLCIIEVLQNRAEVNGK